MPVAANFDLHKHIGLVYWERSSGVPVLQEPSHDSSLPLADEFITCLWWNGFIANRAELLERGGLDTGTTDCALLLWLYKRFGNALTQHIVGPCAWVVWDSRRRELVLARDRMGIQSLYYAAHKAAFWASNRVETLVSVLQAAPAINPRSLVAQINAEAPLAGETFYEGIQAVEPGCLLGVTGDCIKSNRYWRIEPRPPLKLASDAEYANAYRELLFQVVGGYVPHGRMAITLSSGMDSTSVAAALRTVAPAADLTAFSWVTPELPEADESRYCSKTSKRLGLNLVTLRADLHWPLSTREGIITSAATPFHSYYTEMWDTTFQEMQHHGIQTAFSGISGDHLFGGNVIGYPDLLLTGRWLELARQLRTRAHLPPSIPKLSAPQLIRQMILGPIAHAYLPRRRGALATPVPWLREEQRQLYQDCFGRSDRSYRMLPGRKQRLELLRDRLLPHVVEEASLQAAEFNIELRHPLLDYRLVEFAVSLPTTQTFRAGQRKIIMRNAMRGILPDEIVDMWVKIVPTAISERGLREREQAKVWPLMTNMRAAELGLVDEQRLRQAYQDYLDRKTANALFWYTLTLEDWLRRYF